MSKKRHCCHSGWSTKLLQEFGEHEQTDHMIHSGVTWTMRIARDQDTMRDCTSADAVKSSSFMKHFPSDKRHSWKTAITPQDIRESQDLLMFVTSLTKPSSGCWTVAGKMARISTSVKKKRAAQSSKLHFKQSVGNTECEWKLGFYALISLSTWPAPTSSQ